MLRKQQPAANRAIPPDREFWTLMAVEHQALRRLLAGELPLDGVGPHLRQSARRALRADDPERMRLAATAIVNELVRRGDLLRIAVEEPGGGQTRLRPLYLLKNSNRVVDLTAVGSEPGTIPRPDFLRSPDNGRNALPEGPGISGVTGMLGAMEDAQDLEIGDVHSGEKGVVLAGILRLLGKFTPQFRLYIMLDQEDPLPEDPGGVFAAPDAAPGTHWLSLRSPGQAVWIPDITELPDPVRASLDTDGDEDFVAAAAVAVPLWEPPQVGAADEEGSEAGLFFLVARDDLGREALLRLADRLTRFVTRRWQHQWEVNQRIHTDGLTGAFNRAYFDKQFTLELERARRSDVPLTLIAADLDHFKAVNDTYGHQTGDLVLQMVARRLHEELRRIDHVCRIGGEEFALILPDTGPDAAREVAMRLLDAPFTADVLREGRPETLRITFSYGVVTFPAAGSDAFELYRKADAMQYLSKDRGRNQCHFWNSRGDHLQLLPTSETA